MLRAIGIDSKIVNIIENMYNNTECAIVINGHTTEWFKVKVGVRQGCIMSPTLFNIFLEFVMDEIQTLQQTLSLNNDLVSDIRYADDTTLLTALFEKLEISSKELEESCKKWGMKVNSDKCKVISESRIEIKIDNEPVENVKRIVFLGSEVPGTSSDVKRRIALASMAFGRLKEQIWKRRDIPNKLKVRLYYALIVPIAIYASETWTLLTEDERKLEVFENFCLRTILGVTLRDRVRNTKVKSELKIERSITYIIRKKD